MPKIRDAPLAQRWTFPEYRRSLRVRKYEAWTSTGSLLSSKLPQSVLSNTDHYRIMADLQIKPFDSFTRFYWPSGLRSGDSLLATGSLPYLYPWWPTFLLQVYTVQPTSHSGAPNPQTQFPYQHPWFTSYLQAFETFLRSVDMRLERPTGSRPLLMQSRTQRFE